MRKQNTQNVLLKQYKRGIVLGRYKFDGSAARMLKMLNYIRKNGLCKIEEISKELNIDERTIRRYKTELANAGINILSKSGANGGYYIEEPILNELEMDILKDLLKNHKEIYAKIEYKFMNF